MNTNDKSSVMQPWGTTVTGREINGWVKVDHKGSQMYLPMAAKGHTILERDYSAVPSTAVPKSQAAEVHAGFDDIQGEGNTQFRVSSDPDFMRRAPGVQYRRSMDVYDKGASMQPWGTTVTGREMNGWVAVSKDGQKQFLPMMVEGHTVLAKDSAAAVQANMGHMQGGHESEGTKGAEDSGLNQADEATKRMELNEADDTT